MNAKDGILLPRNASPSTGVLGGMNGGPNIHKYAFAFIVAGLIALVGFGSGDISFGIIGLAAIAILGGTLAVRLAGR